MTDNSSNAPPGGQVATPSPAKHIPVATWLDIVGLREYEEVFIKFNGVEDLMHLTEADVRDLGVKNSAHRARIVSSLVMLREKLHRKVHLRKDIKTIDFTPNLSPDPAQLSVFTQPDYAALQVMYQPLASVQHGGQPLLVEQTKDSGTPGADLSACSWFHGSIPRQKAENLVVKDGDFLLRESSSQPGDYVLTCRWNGAPLHFIVNKQPVRDPRTGSVKLQYQFEDELFDSVPALMQFYLSSKKMISASSKAVMAYGIAHNVVVDYGFGKLRPSPAHSPWGSPSASPVASPHLARKAQGSPQPSLKSRRSPQSVDKVHGSPQLTRKSPESPLLAQTPKRTGSQPLLSFDDVERPQDRQLLVKDHYGSLPSIPHQLSTKQGSGEKSPKSKDVTAVIGRSVFMASEPSLLPPKEGKAKKVGSLKKQKAQAGSDTDLSKNPPPKPSRVPTVLLKVGPRPTVQIRNKQLYDDDGRDYADYSQVKSWPSNMEKSSARDEGSVSAGPRPTIQIRNKELYDDDGHDYADYSQVKSWPSDMERSTAREEEASVPARNGELDSQNCVYDVPKKLKADSILRQSTPSMIQVAGEKPQNRNAQLIYNLDPAGSLPDVVIPDLSDMKSHFRLADYDPDLLTPANKPLESSAIATIKALLLDCEPMAIAQHMTFLDLDLLKVMGSRDLGLGVYSGLELITLPHGVQLRQDVIERYCCLKLFTCLTILTCTKYQERAHMVSQWIQVAALLRGTLGNLFSFATVMESLKSDQVTRLLTTWQALKQKHSESSSLFEYKLCSTYQSLNEAGSSLPLQNVTLPHILPLVQLMERPLADVEALLSWEEETKSDAGLDVLLAHLDTARIVTEQCGLYRVTSRSVMQDFRPNRDLLQMFQTELHLRLLWGAKGATANFTDRISKFDQVLKVLSEKVEPSQSDTSV